MLNNVFWNNKYRSNEIPWDIGSVSTPIKTFVDQLENKSQRILVPGMGNGYEVGYMYHLGFSNVLALEISEWAIASFVEKNPDFPKNHVIHEDFFEHSGQYDIIVEQTFFCALDPVLRPKYVKKMYDLLRKDGYLVGVLFNTYFGEDGPPFGGDKEEYLSLFSPYFTINKMESCYNSLKPRQGNELFVKLTKKQ